jgi:hypothetical protein
MASGEEPALGQAHAGWCLDFAEWANAGLRLVADAALLDQLEADQGNLRAALRWLIDNEASDASLRLAAALWPLWFYRGQASEGRWWLEQALALHGAPKRPRAEALFCAAWLAYEQVDLARAIALAEEADRIFQELGDAAGGARAQWILGSVVFDFGDRPRGEALLTQALAAFRAVGDPMWIARGLNDLGESVRLTGDLDRAALLYEEGLALARELGATGTSVYTLHNLGLIARARGDWAGAAALWRESLDLAVQQGNKRAIASHLEALGALAGACEQGAQAARLLGAAERLREMIAVPLPAGERAAYEDSIARARSTTDAATFAEAWAAGRAVPLAQALAEAAVTGQWLLTDAISKR